MSALLIELLNDFSGFASVNSAQRHNDSTSDFYNNEDLHHADASAVPLRGRDRFQMFSMRLYEEVEADPGSILGTFLWFHLAKNSFRL